MTMNHELLITGFIPTKDPYEEAAQQALEQASHSSEYLPDPIELEDHAPVYVQEPEYPEYLALSDDDIPMKDQPLPADASLIALSPGYIADSDPKEDFKEDPADRGDDDDDDVEEDEDDDVEEDEDEEEEEHLALADSTAVTQPTIELVPSAEETEPFETDKFAATPPPLPAYRVTARMFIRSETPIPFLSKEEVNRLLTLPTPPPSPLTPLSSPLPQIPSPPINPTYAQALLGDNSQQLPAPSTSRRADISEADMLFWKRLLLTAPTPRMEVGETSAAGAARRSGSTMAYAIDYSFIDTIDVSIRCAERRTMAAIEHQDAEEDHATVRVEIRVLRRERLAYKQESSETYQALARSEAHNKALEAHIATMETQLHRMEWQRQDANHHAVRHIMRTRH
ncbi:hypothetical protein Tco_0462927 [Tanacetum coccineum]